MRQTELWSRRSPKQTRGSPLHTMRAEMAERHLPDEHSSGEMERGGKEMLAPHAETNARRPGNMSRRVPKNPRTREMMTG